MSSKCILLVVLVAATCSIGDVRAQLDLPRSPTEITPKNALSRLDELVAICESDANANQSLPGMHTSGQWLQLVKDPESGAFVGPYFKGLATLIGDRTMRYAGAEFMPFPPSPLHYALSGDDHGKKLQIAVIDSGALSDHPLLHGRIADQIDFTGEGPTDSTGHGTIQAIRQALVEPNAQLIIVKVFDQNGRTKVRWLVRAFRYLATLKELDYIFMAGGIAGGADPEAIERVCEAATALVAVLDIPFFATAGNDAGAVQPCPAIAEGVTALVPIDAESLEPSSLANLKGGLAMPQKGPLSSFPDITPMPLAEYFATLARELYDEEYFEAALIFASRSLELDEERAEASEVLFGALFRLERFEEALLVIERRIESEQGDAMIDLINLGNVAEHLDIAKAENAYREAILQDAASSDAAAMAHAELARFLLDQKRYEEAEAPALEAASLNARFAFHLERLAYEQFYRESFAAAARITAELYSVDPTNSTILRNLYICRHFNGDNPAAQEAIQQFRSLLKGFDSAPVVHLKPDELLQRAQLPDRLLQEALLPYEISTRREYAREFIAWQSVLDDGDGFADALKHESDEVRQKMLGAATALIELWRTSGRADLLDKLVLATGDALNDPMMGSPPNFRPWVLESFGLALHHLGRFEEAESLLRESADAWAPLSARRRERAQAHLGFALLAQGRLEDAKDVFMEAQSTALDVGDKGLGTLEPLSQTGLAQIAAIQGDAKGATEAIGIALRDGYDEYQLLPILMLWRLCISETVGSIADGHRLMAQVLTANALKPERLGWIRNALLVEHPFVNELPEGDTTANVIDSSIKILRGRLVGVYSVQPRALDALSSAELQERIKNCGGCAESASEQSPIIGILGSGIAVGPDWPNGRVLHSMATRGNVEADLHGGTTLGAIELLLLQNGQLRLVVADVVDEQGALGGIDDLVYGLLWLRHSGAGVIQSNVYTKFESHHLAGILKRVSKDCLIIADDPPEGAFFPRAGSEGVIIAK